MSFMNFPNNVLRVTLHKLLLQLKAPNQIESDNDCKPKQSNEKHNEMWERLTVFGSQPSETKFSFSASTAVVLVMPL